MASGLAVGVQMHKIIKIFDEKHVFSIISGVVAWKIKKKRMKNLYKIFSTFLTTSIIMHLTSIKAKKINEKKTKPDFILYGQFHAPSRKDFFIWHASS